MKNNANTYQETTWNKKKLERLLQIALVFVDPYPQQESNLHLKFRKLSFYPLNYEGI